MRRLYSALPALRERLIFRLGVLLGPRTSEVFGFTVADWKGDFLEITNTAYKGNLRKAKLQHVAKQLAITVPITFQVLRRSFATRHRNELKDAGDVLGHSNYETTTANVYAQSVSESVIAMLEEDERRLGLMDGHPTDSVQ